MKHLFLINKAGLIIARLTAKGWVATPPTNNKGEEIR